jgi:adenylyl-sulfate kinase
MTAPTPTGQKSRAASDARAALLGHRSAVLWLTGLSGAGKSTLAAALEQRLVANGVLATVIDGDALRSGLSRNLGYTAEDRGENVRRANELALHLAEAGAVVIVALIAPFRKDRAGVAQRMRERGVPFTEVFVNAPLAICERRDVKGLYRKARAGEIDSFTGLDAPYEAPVEPDLDLRTDLESVEESLEKLTRRAMELAAGPEVDRAALRPAPAETPVSEAGLSLSALPIFQMVALIILSSSQYFVGSVLRFARCFGSTGHK